MGNKYCSLPALLTAFLLIMLGGCATYRPQPLPLGPNLAPDVGKLHKPAVKAPATPEGGLSLTEVAVLAVRNNPELQAKRRELGIKRAEVFSAGLLPDPQLSASLDHPTGSLPDTFNGYGLGLDYDIIPLISRGARLESARKAAQQINLELLWQEWQVSQRARILAVSLVGENRQIALLQGMRQLYQKRYRQSRKAVAQGDLTLGVAGTDLTALLDTLSQVDQLEQSRNDTRHQLHLLLGLAPDAPLKIRFTSLPAPPDPGTLRRELATLPRRRPDLLALQAGYHSQEAKVRAAILAQFPSISIGINRARDTSKVYTVGFGIGLDLPLFSGNRGAIAVERATRAQLHAAYQARLDQAAMDVDRLLRLQELVAVRQKQLAKYMPTLKDLVDRGRKAYLRGEIDALTFLNMESTWVGKRLEQIGLEQTQRKNLIALQTLLAIPAAGAPKRADTKKGDKP